MSGLTKRRRRASILVLAAGLCTASPTSAGWVEQRWTDHAGNNYKGDILTSPGGGGGGWSWFGGPVEPAEPPPPPTPKAFKRAKNIWQSNKALVAGWMFSADDLVPQVSGVMPGEVKRFNLGANYFGIGAQEAFGERTVSLTTRDRHFAGIKYDARRLALANVLAVHAKTAIGLGAEDQLFLLGQVSELLQGHDLRVNLNTVQAAGHTKGLDRREAKALEKTIRRIDEARGELAAVNASLDEMGVRAQRVIEAETNMKAKLREADSEEAKEAIRKTYAPALKDRDAIQKQYENLLGKAQELKGELTESRAKVRIRMVGN